MFKPVKSSTPKWIISTWFKSGSFIYLFGKYNAYESGSFVWDVALWFLFPLFSQSLLTSCLEDYWAAYDRSGYDTADSSGNQLQRIAADLTQSVGANGTTDSSLTLEAQWKMNSLITRGNPEKSSESGDILGKVRIPLQINDYTRQFYLEITIIWCWQEIFRVRTDSRTLVEAGGTAESEALHKNLLRKSSMQLISTSSVSPIVI